jgi:membrane-bound lytic murein transglycosylase D
MFALVVLVALAADSPAKPCRSVTTVDIRWLHTRPSDTKDVKPTEAPPVPEGLEFRVAFWERIWGELESGQYVLVDERRPWVIHAEVDCRGTTNTVCANRKANAKNDAIAELKKKLVRDRLYGRNSKVALDAKKHLLFVEGRRDGLDRVLEKHADDVAAAEAMFDLARVPREYARLAVVESMMRSDAVSSAGATGTYQLMPLIASKYLMVREGIDERLDPVRSSLAAAKYLKGLKAQLGTWPHALTSYNTGPTRLRAMMKRLRTKDVAKLVDADSRDGFGWASQNYYAKVAAVARVTKDRAFERREHENIAVRVDKKLSLAQLATCVNVDVEALIVANPSIVDVKRAVPKGYVALVPRTSSVGG